MGLVVIGVAVVVRSPRSNTHSLVPPYTAKYDHRGRISSYFHVIPGSVVRPYFSVLFTQRYDDFRIRSKTISYFPSDGSYATRRVMNRDTGPGIR